MKMTMTRKTRIRDKKNRPDNAVCFRFADRQAARANARLAAGMRGSTPHTGLASVAAAFVLSLLWSAHHSQRSFFKRVDVGPKHEKKLKQFLISEAHNPGEVLVLSDEVHHAYSHLTLSGEQVGYTTDFLKFEKKTGARSSVKNSNKTPPIPSGAR